MNVFNYSPNNTTGVKGKQAHHPITVSCRKSKKQKSTYRGIIK